MPLLPLGTIPGPIIFGAIIDSTCVLWDINECGIKGACWIYDNIKMAHMLVAISEHLVNYLWSSFGAVFSHPVRSPSSFELKESTQNDVRGCSGVCSFQSPLVEEE